MLTISRLSRWSIDYYNDTARQAAQAGLDRRRANGVAGSSLISEWWSSGVLGLGALANRAALAAGRADMLAYAGKPHLVGSDGGSWLQIVAALCWHMRARDLYKFNGMTVRDPYSDCPVCRARLATATVGPNGQVRNSTVIPESAQWASAHSAVIAVVHHRTSHKVKT